MNETKERVKDVVQRLVEHIGQLRAVKKTYEDLALIPFPPASAEEILAYERDLAVTLPPTYKAFLELHNGYKGLTIPGSMLPIRSVRPGGEWFEKIKEWKVETAKYGSAEVLDGIVIASMDGPNQWTYLDPKRPTTNGELTVVNWEPDSSEEFPTLVDFFERLIRYCKSVIERSRAAGTKPV